MNFTPEVSVPASCAVLGATFVWFVYAARRETHGPFRAAFVVLAIAAAVSIAWVLASD